MLSQSVKIFSLAITLVLAVEGGSALAQSADQTFKTQQASLDTSPVEAAPAAPTSGAPGNESGRASTVLNGQISHSAKLQTESGSGAAAGDAAGAEPGSANLTATDLTSVINMMQSNRLRGVVTSLFSASFKSNGNGQIFTLRTRRPNLSPEYFRNLNYGVIGLALVSFFDGRPSVITTVYPTCPAQLAGIRPGDIMYEANGYRFKPGDDQRTLWRVCAGKADTPIDVTVVRDGKPLTFHLNRMNIEDIADTGVRTSYEMLLSAYGAPPQ